MKIEVTVPYEDSGSVIAAICKRFGVITNTEESSGYMAISAEVNYAFVINTNKLVNFYQSINLQF